MLLGVEQDVGGLHVAVHKPAFVGCVQRQPPGYRSRWPAPAERSLVAQEGLQVRALDVTHGQVELTLVLSRVVDRDDVGVFERGGELGVVQEALAKTLVLGSSGAMSFNATLRFRRRS